MIASYAAYDRDSLFLNKCRGFDAKAPTDCLLIHVSGSDSGLVREVEGYFKSAGVQSQTQGLWTIYTAENMVLNNGVPFLEIKVTFDEFESMEASGVESVQLGILHQLRFKGDTAKFIMDAMIKAGVKTKTYGNNVKVAGNLIVCSNTPSIWGYSCELTILAK